MTSITGEQRAWHKITLDFKGEAVFSERPATFRDYRLDVTFTESSTGRKLVVPGYFAADGDAADTGATSGNVWRVNFTPPSAGEWTYAASFRTGADVAASASLTAGKPYGDIHGQSGVLSIAETDKTGDDFRAKGMILQDPNGHYLQHAGDGDYFIRGGPGVPENLLASKEIDNTATGRHDFSTHMSDQRSDDPTWGADKGKALFGAINYLADQGQNAIYILTNTAGGDGRDVWPWANPAFAKLPPHMQNINEAASKVAGLSAQDFSVYDVSKLAQWEILFDHMETKGIYKSLLLQETENDQLLSGGTPSAVIGLSVERLVYIREMVARFGHSNALQWNVGEEITNTTGEIKAISSFLKSLDPYDHLVVAHTFPGDHAKVYDPLLGFDGFDGAAFQTGANIRDRITSYKDMSAAKGQPWVLSWEEDSGARATIAPYSNDPDSTNEKSLRADMWGMFTAGGSGVNWYVKDGSSHSLDQNMDDFKAYSSIWTWTAAATKLLNNHVPFWQMDKADGVTINTNDYVMANPGKDYLIYAKYGAANDIRLDLSAYKNAAFDVYWYNPRTGGDLIKQDTITGGTVRQIGGAPYQMEKDWVILVQNNQNNVSIGKNGLVVIEAENATIPGGWVVEKGIDGFKGAGALRWNGPDTFSKPVAPIEYKFSVDQGGSYFVTLRASRPFNGEEWDRNNDFFISVDGSKPQKIFFSTPRETWGWAKTIDLGGHNFIQAKFDLTQGQHKIEVYARSHDAVLDRIHINKGSSNENAGLAPSPYDGNSNPIVVPPPVIVDPEAPPQGDGGTVGGSAVQAGAAQAVYDAGGGAKTFVFDAIADSPRSAVDLIKKFGADDTLVFSGVPYKSIVNTVAEYNANPDSLLVRDMKSVVVLNYGGWADNDFQLRVEGAYADVIDALL